MPQTQNYPLFAYGTLMSGLLPREMLWFENRVTRRIPATARGVLLHLGDYPGMIFESVPNADNRTQLSAGARDIPGELIFFDDFAEMIRPIDEYECAPVLYKRILIVASPLACPSPQTAWAYHYLGEIPTGTPFITAWKTTPDKI